VIGRLRRRTRARARGDVRAQSGYTLIETMVAMTLLSVVIAAAFGVVSAMQRGAMLTTNRFTAEGEAQTISDRITKDLRAAVTTSAAGAAFVSADQNDVTFYANLTDDPTHPGPTKLHAYLTLQPGTSVYLFHEDSTPPDTGGSVGNYTYSGAASSRIDGKYIDTTLPIFSYFDADNNPIPTPITTVAGLRSIDSVAINLRVRVTPTSPIVVMNALVHIRNTDYNPNT
jgi:prepilin-type N-terminal cleavage/methylation domain-containing protein